MAFPSIGSAVATNLGFSATSHPVTLPLGVVPGDLLLVFARAAAAGAIGWPAGWTELIEDTADASDDVTALAYRTADGTEGTNVSVTHGLGKFAALAWRIRDAEDQIKQPPEASVSAVGFSTFPNAESLSPTGGAKDYLWLALAACQGEAGTAPTYPTGYTLSPMPAQSGSVGVPSVNVRLYGAGRILNAASEDPGPFTISVACEWTAYTIAIHPATVKDARPDPVNATAGVLAPVVTLSAGGFFAGAPGAFDVIPSPRENITARSRPAALRPSQRTTIRPTAQAAITPSQRETFNV